MKSLPVGTAYAVWVGVGAVGTAILGIVLLGEPANIGRVLSLALILAGIIGLKLSTQAWSGSSRVLYLPVPAWTKIIANPSFSLFINTQNLKNQLLFLNDFNQLKTNFV